MAMPTITSQARWTVLASRVVGRSSSGKLSRPWITVFAPSPGSESQEARSGMGMPPVTSSWALSRPSRVSGTWLSVCGTSSMAANFVGSLL